MKNMKAIEELRDEVVSKQRAFWDKGNQALSSIAYCQGNLDSYEELREKMLVYNALRDQLQYIEDRLHEILKEWE